MNPRLLALAALVLLVLATPSGSASGSHYVPVAGDQFHYSETIELGGGTGNYSGYTEATFVNGTVAVTAVASNGTESASYSNTVHYTNNNPQSETWTSAGTFTFSANTFLYVDGTDNQTGYTNPSVWFYMNNSLPVGSAFSVLNTPMRVVSTDDDYALGSPTYPYVVTIYAQGSGTYQRNDDYGVFTASYTWDEYFDPATGYVVGYVYTEQDTDGAGDGFSITDVLGVTSTTYPLTAGTAPPATAASNGLSTTLILGIVLLVVVVIILVVWLAARSRRRSALPKHSARGNVSFGPPPGMPPSGLPPPISLTPSGQPPVQQVVLRETVKVNCRYCGTLIDSTATVCPNCGAPRT